MGIRNSFGLGVDPVTGYLWDTENGPDNWDEGKSCKTWIQQWVEIHHGTS